MSGKISAYLDVKRLALFGIALGLSLGSLVETASAGPIPAGYTCIGNCGTEGADGVVTLSPSGNSSYQWVSTSGGQSGAGQIVGIGGTNGSSLSSPIFAASAGNPLQFYFNFVTSDGAGFADYGWAGLFNDADSLVATLFTARTQPSGTIAPGFGLPPNDSTLTPAAVPIIPGGPAWSPLGGSSGSCFSAGCGYTDWVQSNYSILADGNYYLQIGVTNWSDTAFDTGLALDGITIAGAPVGGGQVPEPMSLAILAMGLLGLGVMRRANNA